MICFFRITLLFLGLHAWAKRFALRGSISGPGRVPWCEGDVRAVAMSLKASIPMTVQQVLMDDSWPGGDLVQLESEIRRASSDDCITNFCWLKPFARAFPTSVPSGFYCADVWLYADKLMQGRLLKPTQVGETKAIRAGKEGGRIKRLMSGLRYLWRSST